VRGLDPGALGRGNEEAVVRPDVVPSFRVAEHERAAAASDARVDDGEVDPDGHVPDRVREDEGALEHRLRRDAVGDVDDLRLGGDPLDHAVAGADEVVLEPEVAEEGDEHARRLTRGAQHGGGEPLDVGPDNGLLVTAAERAGIDAAHELANPEYALESVSRTFHGRDLFAPAAAHLATGVGIEQLGPPLDPDALVRLDLPEPRIGESRLEVTALYVDSFGNIALNLTRDAAEGAGIVPGTQVELELAGERYYAVAARTFADARAGDIILYEDSYRNMSIAISNGNAAQLLHASQGQGVRIRIATP
jgi:hypothetical protein